LIEKNFEKIFFLKHEKFIMTLKILLFHLQIDPKLAVPKKNTQKVKYFLIFLTLCGAPPALHSPWIIPFYALFWITVLQSSS
jgi:hypothetical protein